MRIAFLGTSPFAVPVLEALLTAGHHVAGVVTGPDKPAGRGRRLQPTPVKVKALEHGLPVLTPARLKDPAFLEAYRAWQPEAAVVVAFRILPPAVFDLPDLGTINVHPSLLPRYRGPAPINWALINGDTVTGVSIIRITKTVDAGGVILQRTIPLDPLETADDLARRLAPIGGKMAVEALEGVRNGSLHPLPQDESLVTRAPKLEKEDGRIDWHQPATSVHNRVRGVIPWPGAFTTLEGRTLKLFASRPVDGSGSPGEILSAQGDLVVACGQGAVAFSELQAEGKKRMPVSAYLRGNSIPRGTILGEG